MTSTTVPVIFDLDGTLVDPAGGITDGIAAALTEFGIPVPSQDLLDAMVGPKLSDSLLTIARVPPAMLKNVIRSYRLRYAESGIAQSRLYPGMVELLDGYVASGRPVAVATQKPETLANLVLQHHRIADRFLFIRGSAEDETAAAAGPVGKTGIIAAALADLRTQHAIMVGDRAQDVAGAFANGIDCIGVSWGFAPDGELEEAGAVAVVPDTLALRTKIEELEAVRAAALSEVRNDGAV
ncbi:HAD hydrolase-like protein [Arthrobacter sp. ISL-5]|uniref:HAD hydrolase-like protein n=1 Tax=Arthrobacter sp. ISL-5 TaxID=2819111 RepID=UPI001BE96780|nr:HAD hydrolase-like protein [Arthrobacter sp. ISL-5]MBT2551964.1 HAD hydrolase-like protein [Arthrobacter sp. ISL-5]